MQFTVHAHELTSWAQISAALTLVNNTLSAPVTVPAPTAAHVHDDIAVVEVRINPSYLTFYTADSSGYTELFVWNAVTKQWQYTEDFPTTDAEMP